MTYYLSFIWKKEKIKIESTEERQLVTKKFKPSATWERCPIFKCNKLLELETRLAIGWFAARCRDSFKRQCVSVTRKEIEISIMTYTKSYIFQSVTKSIYSNTSEWKLSF